MAFSNGQNNLSYCWYFLIFFIIITYFFVFQAFRPNLCTTDWYTKSDGLCACGFFLEIGLTFQIAADTCHSYGARLPEIKDLKESNDINAQVVIKKCRLN
jgi:hypothetical protein